MESVIETKKGCMKVFTLIDSRDRKRFHEYLDTKYPSTHHAGVRSGLYPSRDMTYYKCCDNLIVLAYCYGNMSNNFDESYSGYCHNCCNSVLWEPNSDGRIDGIVRVEENNVVMIGNYFSGYSKTKYETPTYVLSDEQMLAILNKHDMHEIVEPTNSLSRKKLGPYVDQEIRKLDTIMIGQNEYTLIKKVR